MSSNWDSITEAFQDRFDESKALQDAIRRAFAVTREPSLDRQRELMAADIKGLLDADVVRVYGIDGSGRLTLRPDQSEPSLPDVGLEIEGALVDRAQTVRISLLSSRPDLDDDLTPLAARCASAGLVTHVLIVKAGNEILGAFAAHWINHERPAWARRRAFHYYFDMAGFTVAANTERRLIEDRLAELHKIAYFDEKTGLPSQLSLDDQLRDHTDDDVLSILYLDFDGMREANSQFGYEDGGDVLIRQVGEALRTLTLDPEFPARPHRGGDEFAVILPGADAAAAAARAAEIERRLDALQVEPTHQHLYRGASVGHATREPGENPGQTLGRAIEDMTVRKRVRRAEHKRASRWFRRLGRTLRQHASGS